MWPEGVGAAWGGREGGAGTALEKGVDLLAIYFIMFHCV